jgi:hypothetical protein
VRFRINPRLLAGSGSERDAGPPAGRGAGARHAAAVHGGQHHPAVRIVPEITEWGGEQLGFEFSDESRLLVRAIPPKAGLRWPHGQPLTADYFFSFFKSPHAKAFIVTP